MGTIVFDLDDTIIPSSQLYKIAIDNVFKNDVTLYQEARNITKNIISQDSTQKHSRLIYFKNYLELKNDFSPKKLIQLYSEYEIRFKESLGEWWSTHPEQLNTLLYLRKKNYRILLATNETLSMQALKMSIIDPDWDIFDGMLTSEEVGHEKPSKKYYENLIKKFSILPDESFFIGDDIRNDILGPQSFKFKSIWTTNFSQDFIKNKKVSAYKVINNLKELMEFL